MKSLTITAAALALASFVSAAALQAEHHETEEHASSNSSHASMSKDKEHAMTAETTHRASKIIGLTVKNGAGKELGSVEDFVINSKNGKIEYVAVSFGGFAGIGDKLFAVPYGAVDYRKQDEEVYLIVDVEEQTLKNAKGFDQDNWPDMANSQWRKQNDSNFKMRHQSGSATTNRR